jgi:hypothetical protein
MLHVVDFHFTLYEEGDHIIIFPKLLFFDDRLAETDRLFDLERELLVLIFLL